MRRVVPHDDVERLVRSAQRLARLAQTIGERAQVDTGTSVGINNGRDALVEPIAPVRLVEAAREAIAAHLAQPDFGAPALLRNRNWLLMLELFIAKSCGAPMPVKAACLTLGGPTSTALRIILELERFGLIASSSDDKDARRRLLMLTVHAEEGLRLYLTNRSDQADLPLRLSLKLTKHVDASGDVPSDDLMQPRLARSNHELDTVLQ